MNLKSTFPHTAVLWYLLAGLVAVGCSSGLMRSVPGVTYSWQPVAYDSHPYLLGASGTGDDSVCREVLRRYDLVDMTDQLVGKKKMQPCMVLGRRDGRPFEQFDDSILAGLRSHVELGRAGPIYRIVRGYDGGDRVELFLPELRVTFRPDVSQTDQERVLREVNAEYIKPLGIDDDVPHGYDSVCGSPSGCQHYTVGFSLGTGEGINSIAKELLSRSEVAFVLVKTWRNRKGIENTLEHD